MSSQGRIQWEGEGGGVRVSSDPSDKISFYGKFVDGADEFRDIVFTINTPTSFPYDLMRFKISTCPFYYL